ncbi:MAG TPA: phosphate ABC transporter permease subunit PstC [Clostridiales bacterium]|nr:phosphate ABC transporter permease subunit PstC [Clostridiales bacterium]
MFFFCAFISVFSLALITAYIFIKGTPIIFKIGLSDFIFNKDWNPDPVRGNPSFGIFSMIAASMLATFGSVIAGSFLGILTAVFLAEIAPLFAVKIFKPAIELLAGIPSVVYGFFGLVMIVPLIRKYLGPPGNSLLAVIIILTFMILPTIVNISEAAIKAVPAEYKEGSLAVGATHIQTIFKVVLPAAKSGILASVILGMGRAIGETMAVILVAGNSTLMPESLLSPVRTLTANIALEMGYAFGDHESALFATGVVLFIFIMTLNIIFNMLVNKAGGHHD